MQIEEQARIWKLVRSPEQMSEDSELSTKASGTERLSRGRWRMSEIKGVAFHFACCPRRLAAHAVAEGIAEARKSP